MIRKQHVLIVLLCALVAMTGYSQNGAVFNPLQPVVLKSSGGSARETAEFLLKQNTAYLLRLTEVNVSDTHINWELDWYEHTNKE
ncbi:hypothetical protein EOM60_05700 [Candidatus Saccharibacteria bacterium]|nr:hypothetical protein [Candidatus Saccharibacteria bacterium]